MRSVQDLTEALQGVSDAHTARLAGIEGEGQETHQQLEDTRTAADSVDEGGEVDRYTDTSGAAEAPET